jgi:putative membrane protein
VYLDPTEADAIEARIADVERRTGVQVVTAIVGKSDTYVELPWKAFALGASLSAFVVVVLDWLRPDWTTSHASVLQSVVILVAASVSALLAVFVPAYAFLYLRPTRRDSVVRQYAEAFFLRRQLFNTRERTAVLILVSEFERKVEILADAGLAPSVSDKEWRVVIARMTASLARRRYATALQDALSGVEHLLASKGFHGGAGASNELPDRPIEERGSR